MTLRYLVVVLTLTAIGAGMLGLRQQQLNDKHAIAERHRQMREDREQIKSLQVYIAERATPEALREAIERNEMQLEPIAQSNQPQASADTDDEAGRPADNEDESAHADDEPSIVAAIHNSHADHQP